MKKYCVAGIILMAIALVALVLYASAPKLSLAEPSPSPETEEKETELPLDPYAAELVEAGFPRSYAVALSRLHEKYPEWSFEPLQITELKSAYSWRYVILQEMEPRRNLVTTGTWAPEGENALYSPYYDQSDPTLYDSGWRQASRSAVEYFMDPRNFLNEQDIFMFETLAFNPEIHTEVAVEDALAGSFMASDQGTVNGVDTYASMIYEKSKECNLNPVYVANRIIMEQGTDGKNPLSAGRLGDVLWEYYSDSANRLESASGKGEIIWGGQYDGESFTKEELLGRNGLYNFFNMGAAGTGKFAIYMNGSVEAETEGWTTKEAALCGGIEKLRAKYIDNYQFTPYFQKFNVHPSSSNNFWGQYMQDISGALTGGRRTYDDYSRAGCLAEAYHFVIPVYGNMPEAPCPDPAGGRSYYSPTREQ